MTYSREKLATFLEDDYDKSEYQIIVQELVNKALNNETISLAEQEFVCGIIKNLRSGETNELAYNIDDCKPCKDYNFRRRYMLYANDLNGHKTIIDFNGEIPLERKIKDAKYLDKEHSEWEKFISDKTNGNDAINYVAQETNAQLKILKKKAEKFLIGSHYQDYLKKSLTLHGKYIYLLVKEFYQELGTENQIVECNGNKILIDSFTYVHTMFRHFAEGIMSKNQFNKSYHFDEHVGFKSIPNFLFNLITCYSSLSISKQFNGQNIDFLINGKPYSIFLKPVKKSHKGNIQIKYLRVQTFFPVENAKDLKRIERYKIVKSDCGFDFLIQNVT
jgi:hypothetical protein